MMSLCAATSARREGRYFSTHIWFFFDSSAALSGALPLSAFLFSPTWGSLSTSISTESVIASFAGSCRSRRVPTRRCASRDGNAPLASRPAAREGASARECVRGPSPVRDRDCGASAARDGVPTIVPRRKQTRSAGHLGPGHTTCDRVTTFFMVTVRKRCVLLRRPPAFALALRAPPFPKLLSRHELVQPQYERRAHERDERVIPGVRRERLGYRHERRQDRERDGVLDVGEQVQAGH